MISGHAGSLSTIHANTPLDALIRLETLSLMSDVQIPVYVARAQVASAIDLIVQIARFTEDGSRKITRITEAVGLDENNQYQTIDLFRCLLHGKMGEGRLISTLEPTGERATFAREPYEQGLGDKIRLTEVFFARK
jgi:pilus assembly protein CpaF